MDVHKKDDRFSDRREKQKLRKKESAAIDDETSLLTPEQIEEFFQATEDGSIERLEQLFAQTENADPNMTRFTESLLMAAIRTDRNDVADYLIDQLAVNVQYAADLREFRLRSRAPVRHRTFSCRDLAYEKGMMELVDLIDLTSNNVTPHIKRYLKTRLQPRLNHIHQAYLKRLEEQKHSLFQSDPENVSIENQTNENITSSSPPPMLPTISHRPYKSRIDEAIENLDTPKDKSIDETGKKTFRFSNYTLRFRLMETANHKSQKNEQFPSKSSVPTLPTISLFESASTPLLTTNNTHRSINDYHSRPSTRVQHRSIYPSIRQSTLPQLVHAENKPSIRTSTKRYLSKKVNQDQMKYTYISQPRNVMPVTLRSTDIRSRKDEMI